MMFQAFQLHAIPFAQSCFQIHQEHADKELHSCITQGRTLDGGGDVCDTPNTFSIISFTRKNIGPRQVSINDLNLQELIVSKQV